MTDRFDLVVVGGGSAGITAARFAAELGARVALIEADRLGGDCTWTGCVPSKTLIALARLRHQVCRAAELGLAAPPPPVDLARVRAEVRGAMERAYRHDAPEELERRGVDVAFGAAHFVDPHTLVAGERTLRARRVLICTGASPAIPELDGLAEIPYVTYRTVFESERLPGHLVVLGGGPVGIELAQAYRRLGAQVTVVAPVVLAKEEPEARAAVERVLAGEGARRVAARATAVRRDGDDVVLAHPGGEVRGDLLLVAVGRCPRVQDLGLARAGIVFDRRGIRVDHRLRTSAGHVYAAGDVVGGPQFTHLAGWQGFHAARNALLPGGTAADAGGALPRVTFVDPEVAQVGLTEAEAVARHKGRIAVERIDLADADRAICERVTHGFIKTVASPRGRLLGATIVAPRAGEMIAELALVIRQRGSLRDIARTIHAYPTWSMSVHELASRTELERALAGVSGRLAVRATRLKR